MIRRLTSSFTHRLRSPAARTALLVAYYLVVQIALFVLYARADFSAPAYIYQAF